MADASTNRDDLPKTGNKGIDESIDQVADDKIRYPDPKNPNKTLERSPEKMDVPDAPTLPEPSGTDGPGNDPKDQPTQKKSSK